MIGCSKVIVAREDGISCFNSLRSGPRLETEALLCPLDLIESDGTDVRRWPIEDRKFKLLPLLRRHLPGLEYNQDSHGDGELVCALKINWLYWCVQKAIDRG